MNEHLYVDDLRYHNPKKTGGSATASTERDGTGGFPRVASNAIRNSPSCLISSGRPGQEEFR
jgi:hypothetical protein